MEEMEMVRSGSRGDAVLAVQKKLAALGINPGPLDGMFGPKTDAAVRRFQEQNELQVDGIVGPQTFGALGMLEDEDPEAPPAPRMKPTEIPDAPAPQAATEPAQAGAEALRAAEKKAEEAAAARTAEEKADAEKAAAAMADAMKDAQEVAAEEPKAAGGWLGKILKKRDRSG